MPAERPSLPWKRGTASSTPQLGGNERAVGEAVKRSGLREAVFLTSKVWIQDAGYEKTSGLL